MQGLRKQAGNHAHALHQVPRNSRHLYVHAYQSYLWNAAASHRVRTHGAMAAVAGDLVIPSEGEAATRALCCCAAISLLASSSWQEDPLSSRHSSREEVPVVNALQAQPWWRRVQQTTLAGSSGS